MKLKNIIPVLFLSLLLQSSCNFTPRKPVKENYDFTKHCNLIELSTGINGAKVNPQDYNNDGVVDYLETKNRIILAYDTTILDSFLLEKNNLYIYSHTIKEGTEYFQKAQKTIDMQEYFMYYNDSIQYEIRKKIN